MSPPLNFVMFFLANLIYESHVVYDARPCIVIITLDRKLYSTPEVVPSTTISLISAKQFRKVISCNTPNP
jgi:hypothetical protein